jgi:hypothetical protein
MPQKLGLSEQTICTDAGTEVAAGGVEVGEVEEDQLIEVKVGVLVGARSRRARL